MDGGSTLMDVHFWHTNVYKRITFEHRLQDNTADPTSIQDNINNPTLVDNPVRHNLKMAPGDERWLDSYGRTSLAELCI